MQKKVFVLDTSVILYDHNALNNFQEHDVCIPALVLEELDNFKNGNDTRNFEARNFIRLIDGLLKNTHLNHWVPFKKSNGALFKVLLNEQVQTVDAEKLFSVGKSDHRILNATLALKEELVDRQVILVSKDICLRLKAQVLEIDAQDYETGKIKNVEELYNGSSNLAITDNNLIDQLESEPEITINPAVLPYPNCNHFYRLDTLKTNINLFFHVGQKSLRKVNAASAFNITPKNTEQCFALDALLNPQIKLVTIQGNAGTGKTLLALASALEQRRNFRQIFVARPIVSLSNKELGFLPGDVKSKVDPYMAPIWDNLKFIREQFAGNEAMQNKIDELLDNHKIEIAPLAFIRGRTLTKVFFIIDEAQNLTPHEIKTIISRAGADTKIVFTGDIYQIDAPYLDAESNGLSYLIENAKHHPLFAHITLQKGERSDLANLANELL
jgi:PhoH-like ATPase